MSSMRKHRTAVVAATVLGTLAIAAAGVAVANATGGSGDSGSSSMSMGVMGEGDRGKDRPAEEPLTGDDATKVEAAVTAAYPDATIDRMEKDADGGATFEAHITKADGTHATVQLDENYAITGETTDGPGHGPDGMGHGPDGMGRGHHGDHDGDGPMDSDATADPAGASA